MGIQDSSRHHWYRPHWSKSHWLHSAFAVAAIGLYILSGMAHTKVSGLPPDFQLDQLVYPIEVGPNQAGSESELLARIAGEPIGERLTLRSLDGTVEFPVVTQKLYTSFHNMIIKINGLFFLAVSLVVFAPRIDKNPAGDLFWACLLYGLAITIGGIHQPQGQVWPGVLVPLCRVWALVILPTLMFHFGLSFPQRASVLDHAPWLMRSVIIIGAIVAIWQSWVWIQWFNGNGDWEAVDIPHRVGRIFLALFVGSGCVGMIFGYRRTVQKREREQVKWLLWGITMGSAPFVFFYSLPLALGYNPMLPVEIARLFSIVIPVAMSFVVIRHKFLDVDIIIRRSLLYILLASMMAGIYAVLGIFAGQRIEERWPETGPFVPIGATIIAAMLFNPTRRGFARLIDKVFFQIRYNHAQALLMFRRELRGADDQQQAADSLAAFLIKHLGLNHRTVLLQHEGQYFLAGDETKDEIPQQLLPEGVRLMAVPGATARSDIETEGFPAAWRSKNFVLAHAIEAEGNRFGHLVLGEKSIGRSYVSEDLDLLAAASRETAICMHRINLKQDFVEEVVARRRIEEMNRFRSQFFAQFAHDLRSPLTSINWAARNLLDGVIGEVSPPQVTYLQGIETSARQLVRLVNNLLEATRLETGLPEVEFSPIDLTHTLAQSLSKIRATAEAKKVELVVETSETAPVFGNEEKLLEVIDNLIENAIRYAPLETRIDIHLTTTPDRTKFVVQDQGPGLDPAEIDAIFEPYRQGAASPHSTQQGFGLGLFVVKSWVEQMGGQVQAANSETGGALFTIELPTRESIETQETS